LRVVVQVIRRADVEKVALNELVDFVRHAVLSINAFFVDFFKRIEKYLIESYK
jgi:predicted nucleic acid-binding OB-fold protein